MLKYDEASNCLVGLPDSFDEFLRLLKDPAAPDQWWLWVSTNAGPVKAMPALEVEKWRYKLEAHLMEEMRSQPQKCFSYAEGMQRLYLAYRQALENDIVKAVRRQVGKF
ncbi:hypothetical protein HPY42_00520 [Coprothermobacteraceae bacterium]|nr:hypothetical protein [Coprothermobacteraceae bacterium]